MDRTESFAFDDLHVGQSATLTRTLTRADIAEFAAVSGDFNPAHVDDVFARNDVFHEVVAHGMWGGALISTVLGMKLPGAGAIYSGQTLKFHRPIAVGDTVSTTLTVQKKIADSRHVMLDCRVTNQRGECVISGVADVIAPEHSALPARRDAALPVVHEAGRRLKELIAATHGMAPLITAVVHPVDENALRGAIEASQAGLIRPLLVGPEKKIRAAAAQAGLDISGCELIATEHSHAAAEKAVQLARDGMVEALMKGALHTQELMQAVVDKQGGLRTARRMSHVFAIDVPTYPRPLFVTDAAINITPSLTDKRDIVQNAIDLAHVLRVACPRVAILSAVETVDERIASTLDAAALCKMADRKQITGGIIDGPLAFDNAISFEAAQSKGIVSEVAGRADILVVPDIESGNILAKQLEYLAGAQMAGVVLGARVPIMLTSRADHAPARMGSAAIALLLARRVKGEVA